MSFSGSSKGNNGWTSKIYFDPESDKARGTAYWISDDELRTEMKELVDSGEKIIEVSIYKVPLGGQQLTSLVFNHQFIVFETAQYWWSIEQNTEGLTVQRSKDNDAVLRRYRQKPRISVDDWDRQWDVMLIDTDEGRRTMGQFIKWLGEKNHLNKKYDLLKKNCKDFAKLVFNEIARSKTL